MQLKLKSRLYDRLMVPSMLLYLALFAGCGIALAQERSIEPMFLEIDKKYQLPEGWSIIPFELEDPYKRVKNGPILANVTHKANIEWISRWIANPKAVVP